MSEDRVVMYYTGYCFGGSGVEDVLSHYRLGCQTIHPLLPVGTVAKSRLDNLLHISDRGI